MPHKMDIKEAVIFSALSFGVLTRGDLVPRGRSAPAATDFAADENVPVPALQEAAAKANMVPDLATYPVSRTDGAEQSTIHSDWTNFQEGAAISWIADMDVDCDGIDYRCKGNPDGQKQTNWGAISAFNVPYIVIPDEFLLANPEMLPGNNVAAVICGGKMFYAILADTNGNDPQVTGEASWLLARTCFPDDGIDGYHGHTQSDVTYIVFTGQEAVLPRSALNKNYITDFTTLRSMGNKLVRALTTNLGIEHTIPSSTSSSGAPSPTDNGDENGAVPNRGRPGTFSLYLPVLALYFCVWAYLF